MVEMETVEQVGLAEDHDDTTAASIWEFVLYGGRDERTVMEGKEAGSWLNNIVLMSAYRYPALRNPTLSSPCHGCETIFATVYILFKSHDIFLRQGKQTLLRADKERVTYWLINRISTVLRSKSSK